jgi:hypothetical protein
MKREFTFKSLLITASFLSLFAFAFVNLRSNAVGTQSLSNLGTISAQVESEEAEESQKMSVPDVTVLGRLWEIAQRFLERTN